MNGQPITEAVMLGAKAIGSFVALRWIVIKTATPWWTPRRKRESVERELPEGQVTQVQRDCWEPKAYPPRIDDHEALSDDWFRSNWPEEHRKDCFAIECDSGCWFEVDLYGEECRCWSVNGHSWDGENFRCRGDVRRFLWYMQAELIP